MRSRSRADARGVRAEVGSDPAVGHPRDRGSATVELAIALPVVVALLSGVLAGIQYGIATGRAQSLAGQTARALARGDDTEAVIARSHAALPGSVVQRYTLQKGMVCVQVLVSPGPLARVIDPWARGNACALGEEK